MPNIDRQREHQANERTFLAWLRTSIALIGFGFAIARFTSHAKAQRRKEEYFKCGLNT
jgi:uncharacterized membrane protein YidH (DUF202 family)